MMWSQNFGGLEYFLGRPRKSQDEMDLEILCESAKNICPLVWTPPTDGNERKIRLAHIGEILKGLAIMLNGQLQLSKRNITASFNEFRRRATATANIDLHSSRKSTQLQLQQIDQVPFLELEASFFDGHITSEMGRLRISMEKDCGDISPRRAGRMEDLEVLEEIPVTIHEVHGSVVDTEVQPRGRTKKRTRRHQRVLKERDIIDRLEKPQPHNLILDSELGTEEGLFRNDFYDRTVLPEVLPSELIGDGDHAQMGTTDEPQPPEPLLPSGVGSPPGRSTGLELPHAPRKGRREDDIVELVLEPLAEIGSRNVRSPKRRRLNFDDKIELSAREIQQNVRDCALTHEEKKELLNIRIRSEYWKLRKGVKDRGLAQITGFGRNHASSRLTDMVNEYLSHKNVTAERVASPEPGPSYGAAEPHVRREISQPVQEEQQFPIEEHMLSPPAVGDFEPPAPSTPPEVVVQDIQKKTFGEIVGPNATRLQAAHAFAIMLKMQAKRKIFMSQDEPFGEITIQSAVNVQQ